MVLTLGSTFPNYRRQGGRSHCSQTHQAAYSIVAMGRGYLDVSWLAKLTKTKAFFVSRIKRRLKSRVPGRRPAERTKGWISDQIIMFIGAKAAECSILLRRIDYRDPEAGPRYVFLINIFHLSPRTMWNIYRERWQVELLFKWIKQNLNIKSFLGTRNAIIPQIWVAVIPMLLVAYYKFRAKPVHSLSQILKWMQLNLFSKRNLWQLFDPALTKHMLSSSE